MSAPLSFAGLARDLHFSPEQAVLMLYAYVDDSGNGDRVAGGCVASSAAWTFFEIRWQAILEEFQVDWFHAVAFEQREKGYRHLTEARRHELLEALRRILRDTIDGGYMCSITPAEVVDSLRADIAAPRRVPQRGKPDPIQLFAEQVAGVVNDPYFVSLGLCIRLAVDHYAIPARDQLHIVVADQPKRNGGVAMVCAWAATNPRLGKHLEGFDYGKKMTPKKIIPLQAADFAAYYISKFRRTPSNSRAWIGKKLRPQYVAFNDAGRIMEGWH